MFALQKVGGVMSGVQELQKVPFRRATHVAAYDACQNTSCDVNTRSGVDNMLTLLTLLLLRRPRLGVNAPEKQHILSPGLHIDLLTPLPATSRSMRERESGDVMPCNTVCDLRG